MYSLKTDHFFLTGCFNGTYFCVLVQNDALGFQTDFNCIPHYAILGIIILAIIIKKMTELSKMEFFRLVSVLVLTLLITVFWSFFELAGTAITLFAERNVNLTFLNASQTNAINPGYIIFLAIPFSMMWVYLSKTQRNPITPIKFALGILQLGLGFIVFAMSAQFMDADGRTPFMFLMIGYLLLTTGELFISPMDCPK